MNKTNYNTNENVKLVNNTTFDLRTVSGAYESLVAVIDDGAALPEAFEDIFTFEVVTRPSGSKYGVLAFA